MTGLAWPEVLRRLVAGEDLSFEEARAVLTEILSGEASPAQIASFVTALRVKGETVEEMSGLVAAMREFAETVPVEDDLVDTCGTGGDGSMSINVSTMAAFVVAGAGARVCKHGGRSASSQCGSADVLEALGVVIDLGPREVAECIQNVGMGFCFAPRFHPAMRHAAPVRKELGVPTVFNFLGPLVNPGGATRQVIGVSDPAMAPRMAGVLEAAGCKRALVVHGDDGMDELSTTTTSTVIDLRAGEELSRIETYSVDPAKLGLDTAHPAALRGGDAQTNARAVQRVLGGEKGPERDVVVLNAAAGIVVAGLCDDLAEAISVAETSIDAGSAAEVLEGLVATTKALARE